MTSSGEVTNNEQAIAEVADLVTGLRADVDEMTTLATRVIATGRRIAAFQSSMNALRYPAPITSKISELADHTSNQALAAGALHRAAAGQLEAAKQILVQLRRHAELQALTAQTGGIADPTAYGAPGGQQAAPEISPAEFIAGIKELGLGMRWMGYLDRYSNDDWRPSPRSPRLDAQLAADDAAEDAAESQGLPPINRQSCGVHRSWLGDCVSSVTHSAPPTLDIPTGYNWCHEHEKPVQLCQCRPATVDGRHPRDHELEERVVRAPVAA
jgi:hypothetical protein